DDAAEVIERRSARDIIRSKVVISIEAASVVGGDSGNIVLRVVRIDIDKSLPDRADLAAPCDDRRLGSRDLRERRDAVHRHDSHVFALAFVVEEEESLVFDDWPADRAAKLIVVEWRLGKLRPVKIVARIERIVPEVLKEIAVHRVSAAL